MTAIPSPMIFCENTGSGTSSNGTALPVSGDSINTFLPSSLLINCSLPDILLRPAFLLCPVSCFCKIVQPLALNIISLHCFSSVFSIFSRFSIFCTIYSALFCAIFQLFYQLQRCLFFPAIFYAIFALSLRNLY